MIKKQSAEKEISVSQDKSSPRAYPVGGRPGYGPMLAELELFTKEYEEYLLREDCFRIDQFFIERRVDDETVDVWAEKYPPLKALVKDSLRIVGSRRERLALQNKINQAIVMKTMPMYDKKIRRMMEWEANLKAKANEAANTGKTVIVVEKFPDSPLVPEKK